MYAIYMVVGSVHKHSEVQALAIMATLGCTATAVTGALCLTPVSGGAPAGTAPTFVATRPAPTFSSVGSHRLVPAGGSTLRS